MKSSRSIALTGLKHVGKTTIGRGAATALGLEFIDLDDLMVRRGIHDNVIPPEAPKKSTDHPLIRALFRALGPALFGQWETDALRDIPISYRASSIVLATGGGVCDHSDSMEVLTSYYHVLYLRHDPVVLYQRAVRRGVPAFLDQDRPQEHFLEIARRRDALYARSADLIIDVAGLSPKDAVARVITHHTG